MDIKNLTKEELEKLQQKIKEELIIKSLKFKVGDKVLFNNKVVTITDIDINAPFKVRDDGSIEIFDKDEERICLYLSLDTLYKAVDKSKELRGLK